MNCPACGAESTTGARFCSQCGARLQDTAQSIPADLRRQVISDLRGEERLVTVVFADMTESVRRTSGLSAEEATELVNPLLETMVELMVRFGGRIDRFLGDGVLAVFGVPTAHEDDPIRAVWAAIELRERAQDLGLAVTAGVNTGRVYFGPVGSSLHEELTVMGPTVNLAARFQGAATAGEVMVGASTAAHIAAAFDLTPVSLTIKGIAEPVEAFKAERLLDHPDKVRGVEGLRAEMVGRDDELERLRTGLGSRCTFAVVGPAGVGKSRLAAEFRAGVTTEGGTWLEGRCLELTESTAYAPFLDLLARRLPGDPVETLRSELAELVAAGVLGSERAEEIAPFLAHLRGGSLGDDRDLRVTESDPEMRRTLTIDAIVELVLCWDARTRTVMFLDDVHWADPASQEVIAALHRSPRRSGMLLLGSRPDPGPDRLLPDGPFSAVELTELSRDDTSRLIGGLLRVSGIPPWLEVRILDHGQGNPFYVEELIRTLIQTGAIEQSNGHWRVSTDHVRLDLPESVEAVLMSRFDRLASSTRRAAKAVSVLDRSFGALLFATLAGADLVPELDALVGGGILAAEADRFSFVHDLTRQAIYGNLLPSQRAELHERAAGVLESTSPADVDQIAFHYRHSRNHPKAVEWLLRAGERALDSYATDTALDHLRHGLERVAELAEADRGRWRGRYLVRLGELRERRAEHDQARALFTEALDTFDPGPVERARILALLGRTFRLSDDFEAAHRAYDEAEQILDTAEDGTERWRAWIDLQSERSVALYFGGRGRELGDHEATVAPVVERHGTAAQRADLLVARARRRFIEERFAFSEDTVDMVRSALAVAEAGADPGRVADTRFALGFALLWADRIEQAAAVLDRAVQETARVGAVTEECRARAYLAIALRRLGRVDETEAAAEAALAAATAIGEPYYTGHAQAVRCWVAWKRDDPDCDRLGAAAYEAWETMERDGRSGIACEFTWLAAWPRAAAAWAAGDTVAALEHLRLLLVPWERPMPPDLHSVVTTAVATAHHPDLTTAIHLAQHHHLL